MEIEKISFTDTKNLEAILIEFFKAFRGWPMKIAKEIEFLFWDCSTCSFFTQQKAEGAKAQDPRNSERCTGRIWGTNECMDKFEPVSSNRLGPDWIVEFMDYTVSHARRKNS